MRSKSVKGSRSVSQETTPFTNQPCFIPPTGLDRYRDDIFSTRMEPVRSRAATASRQIPTESPRLLPSPMNICSMGSHLYRILPLCLPQNEASRAQDQKLSLRMRSRASSIRSLETVRAMRTYPSPGSPNPLPGVVTMPASRSRRDVKSLEVYPLGIGHQI